jgi:hypothetical protein
MPRGNPQNLVTADKRTLEERQKIASRAGKASVESRRRKKTLREELLAILSDGDTQNRVSLALVQQALLGNVKAFETLRDTIGQKPVEKIEQTSVTIDLGDIDGD